MTDVLTYETYFQLAMDELELGETTRINHTTCEAGEDTRRRLYLTRPPTGGGKVLAYCHNCQKGNSFHAKGDGYRVSTTGLGTGERIIEPVDLEAFELGLDSWPDIAKEELFQYGLTQSTIKIADIHYDRSTHRLVFPIYDRIYVSYGNDGCVYATLKGIQKRRLVGCGTKYVTEMCGESYDMSSILQYKATEDGEGKGKYCGIIVEDYISGIRLMQWAASHEWNMKVLVNYGTKVNPEAIKNMTDLYKLIVWLDNDNPHVLEQAKTIATVAKLIQPKNVMITKQLDVDDPKKQGYPVIKEVVNG